jgi:hypothetical protein
MSRLLIALGLIVSLLFPSSSSVASASGLASAPAAANTARQLGPGSRIPWQGQDWFLLGANVPWVNWGKDFGGGGGGGGVSSPDVRATMDEAFGTAKAAGANTVRWWTFEGDAWQITKDRNGMPSGLSKDVYADFDAAVELAETHDLYLVFVLFSAPSHLPGPWTKTADGRRKLADTLSPLFARYANNPRVMTWEVFNEPDHDVWDKKTDENSLRETVREIANAVHANSSAYVTVGTMMLDGLSMTTGLGLDYYQAHWYDYMGSGDWCALCRDYESVKAQYKLDAPLVIGEMYLGPEIENPHLRLDDFYAKGYAGAWPWSLIPEATQDKMQVDWNSVRIFAGRHPDIGPRTTEALSASDLAPTVRLSFTSNARVSTDRPARGELVAFDVDVTSTAAVPALVALQVFSMSGDMIFEKVWDNEEFGPGQKRIFSTSYRVPSDARAGEYVVKIGVFKPGWGKVYDYKDEAAKLTIR